MNETNAIRILVVDDHPMVRSGLHDFILTNDGMELVGEAQNGVEAVEFCVTHDVDVILMDLVMPLMDGSEATRRILALGKPVKVIVLTSFHEQNLVEKALKAGATSYLLKNVTSAELMEAIKAATGGFSMLAPEAAKALLHPDHPRNVVGFDLTKKEREILALLVRGLPNLEIGNQLHISTATVKYHLANIYSKLGVRNRVEATSIALEHNLVEKGSSSPQ
jgi:NarL family two-component system response regulator LiaR